MGLCTFIFTFISSLFAYFLAYHLYILYFLCMCHVCVYVTSLIRLMRHNAYIHRYREILILLYVHSPHSLLPYPSTFFSCCFFSLVLGKVISLAFVLPYQPIRIPKKKRAFDPSNTIGSHLVGGQGMSVCYYNKGG